MQPRVAESAVIGVNHSVISVRADYATANKVRGHRSVEILENTATRNTTDLLRHPLDDIVGHRQVGGCWIRLIFLGSQMPTAKTRSRAYCGQ